MSVSLHGNREISPSGEAETPPRVGDSRCLAPDDVAARHDVRTRRCFGKVAKPTSRAGSHAGRGFRYQDAVSVWLAVEVWAGHRPAATIIPEGGDDIEMRGARTTFVQVKSRRERLGDYSAGEAARHIEGLWARGRGSSPQPDGFELILERGVAGWAPVRNGLPNVAANGPVGRELMRIGGSGLLLPRTTVSVASSPQEASIAAITERSGCVPLAAQMCFAELLNRIGGLADANGTLPPERYAGLAAGDTEGDRLGGAGRDRCGRDRTRDQGRGVSAGRLPNTTT